MNTFIYFAYGSNMSERRLRKRVPSAKVIGTGILNNHCLTFHKGSTGESGKCTIEWSESDKVYGVLFKINKDEECKLDKAEGKVKDDCKKGYKKITVKIEIWDSKCSKNAGGAPIFAKTYQATPVSINRKLKPYSWYKQHVLVGAIEQKLPPCYIDYLIRVDADKDCHKKREACELAIYIC